MDTVSLKDIADSNIWSAISLELTLGVLALSLLVLEIILPKFAHGAIPRISILVQLGWLGALLFGSDDLYYTGVAFGGMMSFDGTGNAFRIFFLVTCIFATYLGMVALEKRKLPRIEYFHILLVVTAALMLLAQANHFVMLFVALETATVGFYVLVSYYRESPLSLEAGLKYLITGALSSSILLFGIVLLYGAGSNSILTGSSGDPLLFDNLQNFLAANSGDVAALIGMILVISGVAFKIGSFPFQIWIPDVYQGAPAPTTAMLAVASKGAGFAMLLSLVEVFSPMSGVLLPMLSVLAGLTILFGNFGALTQRSVKRVIGMSGVSHAGFLLIGVIAVSSGAAWAEGAILFYLFSYLLASMAVFAVVVHMGIDDAELNLEDFGDLSKKNGFLAFALIIGISSLAGIPPLAGFIGKLLIFVSAYQAELYGLLAVAVIGVVVSIYYYFGWIRQAFFDVWKFHDDEEEEAEEPVPGESLRWLGKATILVAVVGTIILGFYQAPLTDWLIGR